VGSKAEGASARTGEASGALAHRIADQLRDEIVAGELMPNERIKQAAVAERFGVSRLPVREALRELASDRWVNLERDIGARVTALDPNELIEIFLMREILEPLAVAEATPRLSAEELSEIHALCDRSEEFAEPEGAHEYLEIDREFHAKIFAGSGMARLCSTIAGLWQVAERYRHAYSILPNRLEISVVEHRLIVEALERGAAEDAAEFHHVHIRRTRLTLAEHPELFPAEDDAPDAEAAGDGGEAS